MIRILGLQRIIGLGILLALNAVLGAAIFLYLTPENAKLNRDLMGLRGQTTQQLGEANRLRTEYDQIQEQKALFEALHATGFFSAQDRIIAQNKIREIQKFTHVLTAHYNIQAAKIEENPIVADAGQVVLDTPVTVKIDAMDDVDFYSFIYWMQNAFPGHVSVSGLTMMRTMDINEAALRQIGNGVPTVLVNGELKLEWRTMIPRASDSGAEAVQGGG